MTEEYPQDQLLDFLEKITQNVSEDFLEVVTDIPEAMMKEMELSDLLEDNISATTESYSLLESTTQEAISLEELRLSVDTFFLLINSFIIFLLQAGFAFLEAGSVRSKNTSSILIKNILNCLVAGLWFWVCGYMIASSEGNAFMGLDVSFMCLNGKKKHSLLTTTFCKR